MLRIGHSGGLCNRLDELTTGYLLADTHGLGKIEVWWPLNGHMPARFTDLFTALPRGGIVEAGIGADDAMAFDRLRGNLPPDYRTSDAYGNALRQVLGAATPAVSATAAQVIGKLGVDDGAVGVHVRRAEVSAPICPFAQPLRYYEAIMRAFPPDTRFFISTDSPVAFRWLQARFGDRVCQQEKIHGNRTDIAGVREGLVDLLILSRCRSVIGTFHSSFSHLAALAGNRPLLMVKPRLDIPDGWPAVGTWRWLWAKRHFLMESTFWTRWLYWSLRPALPQRLRSLLPRRMIRRLEPWARPPAGP